MNDYTLDDMTLAHLVASITRAARAVLLLDEHLPVDVRVAAVTMPDERVFWTLTQLDGDTCQALVRARRVAEGHVQPSGGSAAGPMNTRAAVWTATLWLEERWATFPELTMLSAYREWLDPILWPRDPLDPITGATTPVVKAMPDPRDQARIPAMNWLAGPAIIGPPPGHAGTPRQRSLRSWLRRTFLRD